MLIHLRRAEPPKCCNKNENKDQKVRKSDKQIGWRKTPVPIIRTGLKKGSPFLQGVFKLGNDASAQNKAIEHQFTVCV